DDLHEPGRAQLACDWPEDARPDRLALVVDQHGGVVVEADVGAVGARDALARAHDHGLLHLALLHLRVRDGVLHRHHDHVADGGVAAARATQHSDARHLARAGVVGDLERGLGLDHACSTAAPAAFTSVSWTFQRFFFEIGRCSMIRTRSPTAQALLSAWA